jgi:hypothetical protein
MFFYAVIAIIFCFFLGVESLYIPDNAINNFWKRGKSIEIKTKNL